MEQPRDASGLEPRTKSSHSSRGICRERVTSMGGTQSRATATHPRVATSWIDRAGRAPGSAFPPVDRDILLAITQLPGPIHGDPVDRIDVVTGLYYARARWYDPATRRFISPDPLGLTGGLNQYAFGGNDPVNGVRIPQSFLTSGPLSNRSYPF